MMLQITEAPQHQHPSVLRRKETPAVWNTVRGVVIFVVGLLLAVSYVNQTLQGFYWLASRERPYQAG